MGIRSARGHGHTAAEKLAARTIKRESGCWEVQGWAHQRTGHTYINRKSEGLPPIRSHRLAWELAHGPIPAGLCVCHRCDNARCVNPDHLFLGTHRDNVLDAVRKGRHASRGRQKLDADKVHDIRVRLARGERQKDIAALFGIARNTVAGIKRGASWGHLDEANPKALGSSPEQPLSPQDALDRVFQRVPHRIVPVVGEVA